MQTRKNNRLINYDYSQNGIYFITFCIKNKHCILCDILQSNVGETCGLPSVRMTEYGEIIDDQINNIALYYDGSVDFLKYVIMPNHIHMLIEIRSEDINGRPQVSPTISRVIQQFKGKITKKIGFSIWQRSFHDHIVRNELEYNEIYQYIENNPLNWQNDCYYENSI